MDGSRGNIHIMLALKMSLMKIAHIPSSWEILQKIMKDEGNDKMIDSDGSYIVKADFGITYLWKCLLVRSL